MQIIGDFFNIILFITVIGGTFTILSLLANTVLGFTLPLWFSICGMAAYSIPLLAPGLYLIPPEEHAWRQAYYIICTVWFCGMILFVIFDIAQAILARRAIQNYPVCDNERITAICTRCAQLVGVKKVPLVYFGTLDDPACVAGVLHPAIILNETIIKQLSDTELTTVVCHEVTHIKRRHILLGRIYDYICILNWFNFLAWIAKKEFAVHCEVDCDRSALASLENQTTDTGYANTMIRLLELTAIQGGNKGHGLSALGFLLTKRRIALIIRKPTRTKKIIMTAVLAVLLAAVILFSIMLSRGHFYPYPAYNTGTEYSYVEQSYFLLYKSTIVV